VQLLCEALASLPFDPIEGGGVRQVVARLLASSRGAPLARCAEGGGEGEEGADGGGEGEALGTAMAARASVQVCVILYTSELPY
jgi:hypothetical protein